MNKEKLIKIFNQHRPNTPMSEDESMTMMGIMMSKDTNLSRDLEEIDKESEVYQHMKPLIESFQAQVFLTRIKALTTLKISLGALLMLMHHMESPGKAVMLTFYLHHKLPENTLVTVETIGKLFSSGFFSESQLNQIWADQKVDSDEHKAHTCVGAPDNMIDYLEAWG